MALRILHIAPYGPEAWAYGGIPRVVGAMTGGLAGRGHDVTLCTTDALDACDRLPPSGAAGPATRRVFRNISNRAAYHLQAFAPRGLRRFLDTHAAGFDIAHIHASHNVLGIMASRALVEAGVPYVVSPNGTAPVLERRRVAKHLLARLGGARVLSDAARVLATSDAEARQLLAMGIERGRVVTVPNPVDLQEFDGVADPVRFRQEHGLGDRPVVLFLGKITPRKGVGTVVDAFAQLGMPQAHLVIAGNDMGGLASARARASARGLDGRLTVTGLLRGVARVDALAAADVVVYPSRDEVFGLVACEALLAGTPVIVGNDAGAAEVVADAGGGLAVPPGDAGALASAVAQVLARPAEWRERARAGAARVRARYSIATVTTMLETVYADVLAAGLQVSA